VEMDQGQGQANLGVPYLCGDCGYENRLKPQDAIICRECGGRWAGRTSIVCKGPSPPLLTLTTFYP